MRLQCYMRNLYTFDNRGKILMRNFNWPRPLSAGYDSDRTYHDTLDLCPEFLVC